MMQAIIENETRSAKSTLLSLSNSTNTLASMAREAVEQVNRVLQFKNVAQEEVSVELGSLVFSEEVLNEVIDACHQAGYRTRYSICNHHCTLMLGI